MTRIFFIFLLTLLGAGICKGQEPALTLETYKSWPVVDGGGLSSDGHYAFYIVFNLPVGKNTFFLKTTTGKEILSMVGLKNPQFSEGSRYLYGLLPGDSLMIFDLRSRRRAFVKMVSDYDLQQIAGLERLMLKYRDNLILCEPNGKTLLKFSGIKDYKFSKDGKTFLLIEQDTSSKQKVTAYWTDAISGNKERIYTGTAISNVIFDGSGTQVAFMATTAGANEIYYFRSGSTGAILLTDNCAKDITPGVSIVKGDYWSFSKDGERLFFSLQDAPLLNVHDADIDLETWSYQDTYLRSYYDGPRGKDIKQKKYLATITIADHKILQLTSGNQRVIRNTLKFDTDTIFAIEDTNGLMTEPWNINSISDYYICYSKNGNKTPVELGMVNRIMTFYLSPTGRYFVYFKPLTKAYCCYDIARNKKVKIGTDITGYLGMVHVEHYPDPYDSVIGVCRWLDGDSAMLIQTEYDIWQVDPKGRSKSVCFTKGMGAKHKMVFFLLPNGVRPQRKRKLLLSAFNLQNKNFAFYEADVENPEDFRLISDGKRYTGSINDIYTALYKPDFMSTDGGYLVRWENADQYPNYFFSKDLKTFKQLSDFQPQRAFNWLSAELCNYQDKEGNSYQGLMYKPENFDPGKKYPIVFSIYETESNLLNSFCMPGLSGININPAILASNGYIVFQPDIRGKVTLSGEAALNCVLSAVNFIGKNSWADTTKMGLLGHSFGGFETSYIVTHTNVFAAACPTAGVHDMIRFATGTWGHGEGQQFFAQHSYLMMGKALSDDLETYIRNSPLLAAKNLKTPLLFMHNDADNNVNVEHTRAFFIVLRSLQKPCWWLNYRGQGHGVGSEKKELDYNTKVWQFLDHYLKGTPMPTWMKEHI
ncbi:prolyl oligopeptidase family serine peptidase [Chitinophaga sp. CF418]|uniref:S9 family peptidase n=1 Tax=Chitinophaga sp. CF418 TaxID=1855287 RepID=UPI000919B47D|nr:prolyl oligopeptidase family serine peptidase [Chitinophaga sp. CF418]SHN45468.1 Prolyl oligopeptidase family protein [Chitinophaga sp. CF418]